MIWIFIIGFIVFIGIIAIIIVDWIDYKEYVDKSKSDDLSEQRQVKLENKLDKNKKGN